MNESRYETKSANGERWREIGKSQMLPALVALLDVTTDGNVIQMSSTQYRRTSAVCPHCGR